MRTKAACTFIAFGRGSINIKPKHLSHFGSECKIKEEGRGWRFALAELWRLWRSEGPPAWLFMRAPPQGGSEEQDGLLNVCSRGPFAFLISFYFVFLVFPNGNALNPYIRFRVY